MTNIDRFVHDQQHRNNEYEPTNYVKDTVYALVFGYVLRSIWRWPLHIGKVLLLGALAYIAYVLITVALW